MRTSAKQTLEAATHLCLTRPSIGTVEMAVGEEENSVNASKEVVEAALKNADDNTYDIRMNCGRVSATVWDKFGIVHETATGNVLQYAACTECKKLYTFRNTSVNGLKPTGTKSFRSHDCGVHAYPHIPRHLMKHAQNAQNHVLYIPPPVPANVNLPHVQNAVLVHNAAYSEADMETFGKASADFTSMGGSLNMFGLAGLLNTVYRMGGMHNEAPIDLNRLIDDAADSLSDYEI